MEESNEDTESADEWPDDSDDFDGDDEDEECNYKNNDDVLNHPTDNNNNNNYQKYNFNIEKFKEIIERHPYNVGFFGEEIPENDFHIEEENMKEENNNNFEKFAPINPLLFYNIECLERDFGEGSKDFFNQINKEMVDDIGEENKKNVGYFDEEKVDYFGEENKEKVDYVDEENKENGGYFDEENKENVDYLGEENKENLCYQKLPMKKRLINRFNNQKSSKNFVNPNVIVQTIAEKPIWNQITAHQFDFLRDIDFDNYLINI